MSAALAYPFEDDAEVSASNDNASLPLTPHHIKGMRYRTVTNTYDALNRLTKSVESAGGPDGAMTRNVAYDTRGNITTLGGLSFIYDMADQPRSISGTNRAGEAVSGGTYVYDGNLKRVKSVVNGVTRYNVYDNQGRLAHVEEDDGNYASETDYLHAAGMTLARIKDGEFTYMHPDHLGSASAGTKEDGSLAFTEFHTPFGEPLTNAPANDNQSDFTGHIRDKDTGLIYMQARYNDPNIGRFLSIDPVTFMDTGDPVHFNRYAYANNDPVNMIDPDGRAAQACLIPPVGAAVCAPIAKVVVEATVVVGCLLFCDDLIGNPGDLPNSVPNDITPPPDGVTDIPGNKPPFTGEPGSTVRGGTGSRTYGEDGYPERDRDTPHPDEKGTGAGDHVHDWTRPEGGGPPTHEDRGNSREPKPGDPPEPRGPNVPPTE